jgi:hypothetical protein
MKLSLVPRQQPDSVFHRSIELRKMLGALSKRYEPLAAMSNEQ